MWTGGGSTTGGRGPGACMGGTVGTAGVIDAMGMAATGMDAGGGGLDRKLWFLDQKCLCLGNSASACVIHSCVSQLAKFD